MSAGICIMNRYAIAMAADSNTRGRFQYRLVKQKKTKYRNNA